MDGFTINLIFMQNYFNLGNSVNKEPIIDS